MRCILCGGDHEPHAASCDPEGMDREIARMGNAVWNRHALQAMRGPLRAVLKAIREDEQEMRPAEKCTQTSDSRDEP
jgi:hypothetical protein